MRTTTHSSRTNAGGRVHGSLHNDRNFDIMRAINIDPDRTSENWYWNCYDGDGVQTMTFAEAELKFYNEVFIEQLRATNANYVRNRHPERQKTMEQFMKVRNNAPEEVTIQIGKLEEYVDAQVLFECYTDYINKLDCWNREHGYPFSILTQALHVDEAVPHIQFRRVWHYQDENGFWRIGQEKALAAAGVSLPRPEQKMGKYNHRKMVFDAMARQMWLDVCKEHGLELEREALPGGRHNRDKEDMIRDKYAEILTEIDVLRNEEELIKQKIQESQNELQEKEELLHSYETAMERLKQQLVASAGEIQSRQEYRKKAEDCRDHLDRLRNLLLEQYNRKSLFRNKEAEQEIISAMGVAIDYIATAVEIMAVYEHKSNIAPEERISAKVENGLHSLDSLIENAAEKLQNRPRPPVRWNERERKRER